MKIKFNDQEHKSTPMTYMIPCYLGDWCVGFHLKSEQPRDMSQVGAIDDYVLCAPSLISTERLIQTCDAALAFVSGRAIDVSAMYQPYLPYDPDDQPEYKPYVPKPALNERKCRKCRNQSLRAVTMPDTGYPVAFCRLCGTEEEL